MIWRIAPAVAALGLVSGAVGQARASLLLSQNLGAGAYSASGIFEGNGPALAFDGNPGTVWNSGGYATQWIEVDLGATYQIDRVELTILQSPAGFTAHQVWLSGSAIKGDPTGATLAYTFAGNTAEPNVLGYTWSTPPSARYLQVRTVASPSWVAWREVKVFGEAPGSTAVAPEPSTLAVGGTGVLMALGYARRRRRRAAA
jgi:hypothetical protein